MGFHCELAILYPEKWPNHSNTAWVAKEVISFGYVTGLNKMTDKTIGEVGWRPHDRAGICVSAILLEKLFDKLASPQVSDFPPPILIYESWNESLGTQGDCVDLGYLDADHVHRPTPVAGRLSKKKIIRHNDVVGCAPDEFKKNLESRRYHPIADAPFLWESCTILAQAIDEAEATNAEAWQEAQKHPISIALLRAWRAYLREVGTVSARALFFYPETPTY